MGAGVTLADLARWPGVDPLLRRVVASIASPQIREMATVGGNLCQAKRCWFYRNGFPCYKRSGATAPCYAVLGDNRYYHAVLGAHRCQAVTPSDLATALVALDATVQITGRGRERALPVARLYTGPGETALGPARSSARCTSPPPLARRVSGFEKLRLWEGDFAVVSACASLDVADGTVRDARVVLGAGRPDAVSGDGRRATPAGPAADAGDDRRRRGGLGGRGAPPGGERVEGGRGLRPPAPLPRRLPSNPCRLRIPRAGRRARAPFTPPCGRAA